MDAKTEILGMTALRVHDGDKTLFVTYDAAKAATYVGNYFRLLGETVSIEEVSGDMVAEYRAACIVGGSLIVRPGVPNKNGHVYTEAYAAKMTASFVENGPPILARTVDYPPRPHGR